MGFQLRSDAACRRSKGGFITARRRYTFLDLDPPEDIEGPDPDSSGSVALREPGGWHPPPTDKTRAHAKAKAPTFEDTQVPVNAAFYRGCDSFLGPIMLLAAFLLTNIGATPRGLQQFLTMRLSVKNILLFAVFVIGWRVTFTACGLYRTELLRSGEGETRRVLLAVTLATAMALVFPLTSASGAFGYLALGGFWAASVVATVMVRRIIRWVSRSRARSIRYVLIVGSGPRSLEIERRLKADARVDYRVVGFFDVDAAYLPVESQARLLARLEDFETTLMYSAIDEVLIGLPMKSYYAEIQRIVEICEQIGVAVTLPADPFQSRRVPFRPSPTGALTLDDAPRGFRLRVKRVIDVLAASVSIALLAPLMLVVAAAIKLTSRGPVLFVQPRFGYNLRIFRMYKFRSMVVGAEALQPTLEDLNEATGPLFKISRDPRLTPIGRFLRRTSIDELPQLFNVLLGEMSMVGPRPMAIRDVHRFSEATLMRRFSVRPGITGLWQVSGRCTLDASSWAKLDLRYVEQWSLSVDLKILLRTVPAVLRGTGAE